MKNLQSNMEIYTIPYSPVPGTYPGLGTFKTFSFQASTSKLRESSQKETVSLPRQYINVQFPPGERSSELAKESSPTCFHSTLSSEQNINLSRKLPGYQSPPTKSTSKRALSDSSLVKGEFNLGTNMYVATHTISRSVPET